MTIRWREIIIDDRKFLISAHYMNHQLIVQVKDTVSSKLWANSFKPNIINNKDNKSISSSSSSQNSTTPELVNMVMTAVYGENDNRNISIWSDVELEFIKIVDAPNTVQTIILRSSVSSKFKDKSRNYSQSKNDILKSINSSKRLLVLKKLNNFELKQYYLPLNYKLTDQHYSVTDKFDGGNLLEIRMDHLPSTNNEKFRSKESLSDGEHILSRKLYLNENSMNAFRDNVKVVPESSNGSILGRQNNKFYFNQNNRSIYNNLACDRPQPCGQFYKSLVDSKQQNFGLNKVACNIESQSNKYGRLKSDRDRISRKPHRHNSSGCASHQTPRTESDKHHLNHNCRQPKSHIAVVNNNFVVSKPVCITEKCRLPHIFHQQHLVLNNINQYDFKSRAPGYLFPRKNHHMISDPQLFSSLDKDETIRLLWRNENYGA
ncbi:hypothetical protein GJ496_001955 [Pomphorhynchus laevis]|nr:hypothetical protein GJ496_001955 [Pomphorhynchus laevis]